MEHQLDYERTANQLMDAWDALPRGPAIFIATLDHERPIRGTWVRLDQPEPYFFGELGLLLSEPDEAQRHREWVVLDQYQAGEPMVPERLCLSGLHRLLAERRGGES